MQTGTLKERLEQAMAGPPKVTAAALARACGIKPPSVSDWLSGRTKVLEASNNLLAAARLQVRPEWLAGLGGPMRSAVSQSARLDVERLAELIETVEAAIPKKVPAANKARMVARITASLYSQGVAASAVESLLASLLTSLEEA